MKWSVGSGFHGQFRDLWAHSTTQVAARSGSTSSIAEADNAPCLLDEIATFRRGYNAVVDWNNKPKQDDETYLFTMVIYGVFIDWVLRNITNILVPHVLDYIRDKIEDPPIEQWDCWEVRNSPFKRLPKPNFYIYYMIWWIMSVSPRFFLICCTSLSFVLLLYVW